ncbi:MAG: glycosyltransferase [Acidaminococcales bacterium]|nr:glycosyltransferase [Acidaminococcales bacterium]
MAIVLMKCYMLFTVAVLAIYTARHFVFTINRLFGKQRIYYHDIIDSDLRTVTVLIPMHNEEAVCRDVLERMLLVDYDFAKFEVIPINDFSEDKTKEILEEYAAQYPDIIKPLHRYEGERGKPAALNEALQVARGDIIIIFDADYLPPRGIIKNIAVCFNDPEVGAVMGRVIPVNTRVNLLTQLLDLERSGGYQVDQQARWNMRLVPQYGGTVGGFLRQVVIDLGSFNVKMLAEDTELTFRLTLNGWKVAYANRAECYEEAPESWAVRARQIRRWSRGHNDVMFKYLLPILRSDYIRSREKIDALLLAGVYVVPFILLSCMAVSMVLFFLGEMEIFAGVFFLVFIGVYNTFGNFAPFYQVGTGCLLDGMKQRTLLIPFLLFNFYFYMWYTSRGFADALLDRITLRRTTWQKTARFRAKTEGQKSS